MTLDDTLVADVDRAVKKLSTNRSAFTRDALRAFLDQLDKTQLEKKHQQATNVTRLANTNSVAGMTSRSGVTMMRRGEIRWYTFKT
jgi:metal-responsive CopG/Arc/MetJ family transcriptional regulator